MNQTTSLDNVFFTIAGADKDLLDKGLINNRNRNTIKIFAIAVIISTLLAFFGGFLLTQFFIPKSFAVVCGLMWATFICYFERKLFQDKTLTTVFSRIWIVIISSITLSVATSFYFSQDKVQEVIQEKNTSYNSKFDNLLTSTLQRHNENIDNLRNTYNDQIKEQNAQLIITATQTEFESSQRLTELRRVLSETKDRYAKDLSDLEKRQKKEIDIVGQQVKENKKNVDVSKMKLRYLFKSSWEIPFTTMGLFFALIIGGFEFLPCLIRLFAQKSDYIQQIQEKDEETIKEQTTHKKKAPSFEDEY